MAQRFDIFALQPGGKDGQAHTQDDAEMAAQV